MADQEEQQNKDQQQHFRMWLNNYVHRRKLGNITYNDEENRQKQTWTATAQLNGTDIGTGHAKNKAGAREIAAEKGLAFLQSEHGTD